MSECGLNSSFTCPIFKLFAHKMDFVIYLSVFKLFTISFCEPLKRATWKGGYIIPGKTAFGRGFKGTFQRRAAAPPSGPLLGSWPTPTTGTLPKATPRAAGGRLLRRSVEMLWGPQKGRLDDPEMGRSNLCYGDPKRGARTHFARTSHALEGTFRTR